MKTFLFVVVMLLYSSSVMGESIVADTVLHSVPPGKAVAILSWTAPGDDGNVGTAYRYDLRMSEVPITEENFRQCTIIHSMPAPLLAGSLDTVFIEVSAGSYYFAIKTADEIFNWSTISNIPFAIKGVLPPDSLSYR